MKKKYNVIFADLDGTLIDTLSGKTFPKGIWDMRIKFDVLDKIKEINPKCLLIVTNQGGIEKGFVDEEDFRFKCEYVRRSISEYTGIETRFEYCKSNDVSCENRKPNTGMLSWLLHEVKVRGIVDEGITKDKMLMIGDASGKEGQFSDSDKKCAENFGIAYMDVNDFINYDN